MTAPAASLPHIEFRLDDGTGEHAVPADVLADVLRRAQRAVHLLAMARERVDVQERVRVPSELARRYTLLCEPPRKGSYVVPATVVDATHGLFGTAEASEVLDTFKTVGQALSDDRFDVLSREVPDGAYRRRVLDEFAGMVLPASPWTLTLSNGRGTFARFDAERSVRLRAHLREVRRGAGRMVRVVAGRLMGIDFDRHQITLHHHPTGRRLVCEYPSDLEEMLIGTRRDWVRVNGEVVVDEQDEPVQVSAVFEIEDVDLSPIHLGTVGGLRFIGGPRSFEVAFDPSGELLVVEDEALSLHAFAPSREELVSEVQEQIGMLWAEYATEAPDLLDEDAARLRLALRDTLSVAEEDAAV